jgi:aryl-alcohol dehydrogenase-like predicted oxidoreductase
MLGVQELKTKAVTKMLMFTFQTADRYVGGMFGAQDFLPSAYEKSPEPTPFEEQLDAVQELVKAGKVRYVRLSNERPYGVCAMVNLAKQFPDLYPKIVSIQNSYSLVVRKEYEAGSAESSYHNDVRLLSYSPLAEGTLGGKYRDKNNIPKGSRLTVFPGFMNRFLGSANEAAVNAYCDLAKESGMTPTELALGWCYHRELVTSTIIRATTMKQLEENLKSFDVRLQDDVQDKIRAIYKLYTDLAK